ncbi:peptidase dimerization protein [Lujinxingia litoralis]|uniref:Peptidase dimerization protein n=1 Tax=Lujinxingia litoralis TaxID=2211119 RepID=A0A328C4U0_9DELT|nr:M20/M25/M40 family metallo-hydrolase [Lujinxingia litoralis]RAL20771.1 peptidase dimerization protein [Lujinxingia litoralis]
MAAHPSPDSLANHLQSWLRIDSTSGQERAFLETLETELVQAGFTQITRQPVAEGRWNLLATTDQPARVLFSTHVDTVPPFLPVRRQDDRIYGRGACDTKGGLLAMLEAAKRLLARGQREVGFLLVVGEEVDHCGAKTSVNLNLDGLERILLCEPTRNKVVAAQKGMLKFTLHTEGVAGHSAFPDRGVSAIERLLNALQALRTDDWPVDPLLGPTTLNVGTITGGVAANVFAPAASAQILMRAVSPIVPLLERVEALAREHEARIEGAVFNDPVFFDPPAGYDTDTVPFNTDATYLSQLAPVWLVGPGDIRLAHADHEHIELSDLQAGIELYDALASQALADRG